LLSSIEESYDDDMLLYTPRFYISASSYTVQSLRLLHPILLISILLCCSNAMNSYWDGS
jgi:hypothetical protein